MRNLTFLILVLLTFTACATKPNFVFLEKVAVDQKTSLAWARNADMPGKQLVWRGDDNVYEYIKRLNDTGYAGYADWRVPTRSEFEKLIGYAKSMGYDEEKIDTWPYQRLRQLGFINVHDYEYWTGTRQSPTEMYVADLVNGKVKPKSEGKPYYLWPVRGTER